MTETVPDPTETKFSDIWQLAIKQYEKEFGINAIRLAPLVQTTASGTIEEIVFEIGRSQAQFETYRKKGEKLRSALKPIVKNVKNLADALGDMVCVVCILYDATYNID